MSRLVTLKSWFLFIGIEAVVAALSLAVVAKPIPAAYQQVARQHQIPASLLYAIALAESGYTAKGIYNPWPWTLNIEGEPFRFYYGSEARQQLLTAWRERRSIDIGLMQINSLWHAHRVNRIDDLLNPYVNLNTAADILREQRQRSQNWWEAIGRYHAPGNDSASKARARRYRKRVQTIYQQTIKHKSGDVDD